MPHADQERRREYQREYKRELWRNDYDFRRRKKAVDAAWQEKNIDGLRPTWARKQRNRRAEHPNLRREEYQRILADPKRHEQKKAAYRGYYRRLMADPVRRAAHRKRQAEYRRNRRQNDYDFRRTENMKAAERRLFGQAG